MSIRVVDFIDKTPGEKCGTEIDALIKEWCERGDVRASTAISSMIAGAIIMARGVGFKRQALVNALMAAWGDEDG